MWQWLAITFFVFGAFGVGYLLGFHAGQTDEWKHNLRNRNNSE